MKGAEFQKPYFPVAATAKINFQQKEADGSKELLLLLAFQFHYKSELSCSNTELRFIDPADTFV